MVIPVDARPPGDPSPPGGTRARRGGDTRLDIPRPPTRSCVDRQDPPVVPREGDSGLAPRAAGIGTVPAPRRLSVEGSGRPRVAGDTDNVLALLVPRAGDAEVEDEDGVRRREGNAAENGRICRDSE